VSPYDDDYSGEPSPSMNLVPPLVGLLVIGVIVYLVSAIGPNDGQAGADISSCATIADTRARLSCFDKLTAPPTPAKGALAPFGSQARERP
jgi:hypothetical protein